MLLLSLFGRMLLARGGLSLNLLAVTDVVPFSMQGLRNALGDYGLLAVSAVTALLAVSSMFDASF